jgi:stage II sporulation protein D
MKKLLRYTASIAIFSMIALSSPSFAGSFLNKQVRIGVIPQANEVVVSTSAFGAIYLHNNGDSNKILDLPPKSYCLISNKKGTLEIKVNNKSVLIPKGKIVVKNLETKNGYSPLVFGGEKWFRGEVEVFSGKKSKSYLTVVNRLPLEEYLYGVVPSEMPASWPVEALKTQAVAARTYVLSNLGQYESEGFDVLSTTASQVYGGVEDETPSGNQAVNETRGKVVTYASKLITAYYCSSAGGLTESGADAWGREIPYLKPVKDFDQDSPRYVWYKTLTNEVLQNVLKKEFGQNVGQIINISINGTTESGRTKNLKFEGTLGQIEIDAKRFRIASKLSSTLIKKIEATEPGTFVEEGKSIPTMFLFTGQGFGHGAGMSQWGARALAKSGKSFEDIIKHYYQGTQIVNAEDIMSLPPKP